jgi:hypothetical protein
LPSTKPVHYCFKGIGDIEEEDLKERSFIVPKRRGHLTEKEVDKGELQFSVVHLEVEVEMEKGYVHCSQLKWHIWRRR